MQTVLIVIHLMVVVALVATVLLQRSEGGALGVGGGGGFMTGRGQANALTRATAVLAAIFFTTSIALTIMAGWSRAPRSILEGGAPITTPGAPAQRPAGNVLDQLKTLEQQRAPTTPAAPAAPAVPEPPKSQ